MPLSRIDLLHKCSVQYNAGVYGIRIVMETCQNESGLGYLTNF